MANEKLCAYFTNNCNDDIIINIADVSNVLLDENYSFWNENGNIIVGDNLEEVTTKLLDFDSKIKLCDIINRINTNYRCFPVKSKIYILAAMISDNIKYHLEREKMMNDAYNEMEKYL